MQIRTWLTHAVQRIHPFTTPQRDMTAAWPAARGERLSFQVGLRLDGPPEHAKVLSASIACRPDAGLVVRVRRVGYVPVPHFNLPILPEHSDGRFPGYVGDPLFDENATRLWPGESQAFWLTVFVLPDCRAGTRKIDIAIDLGDAGKSRHTLRIDVRPVTLMPRRDFHVTNWFYADALLDWYKLDGFSRRFWPIAENYFHDVVEHGQDTLYVPVFTPPLDGVKRPTQLLKVSRSGDRYRFDWSDVRRWVRLAARCGVRRFEFNHLFTQWGARNAIRIYEGQGIDERLLWPASTAATGKTYRNFLAQYLPQLKSFCDREGILGRSLFHLSDEPHGPEHRASYAKARSTLAELARWMKTMDALSEIEFAREGLVDMPVPSIGTTRQFLRAGIPCWTYFCCGPRGRYLQRLMDTPLGKIRASGWLFYRTGVLGFLHWGYNYWYRRQTRELIDPFTVSDAGAAPNWAYGDTFVVYPGQDGPIDSVRWEVFADSMNDYALLATLGVERTDRRLAAFADYDDFPFEPTTFLRLRRALLDS